MKKQHTHDQIKANLELLASFATDVKKTVPMYLYIDKKTNRKVKSELPLKEFLAHIKQLKSEAKKNEKTITTKKK
jgi:hypothetical protein